MSELSLRYDEIDIALDYESVAKAGSMLGTASVITRSCSSLRRNPSSAVG